MYILRFLKNSVSGRFFSGIEGVEYGLISKVDDDPLAEAEKLAATICEKSPDGIAISKFLLNKTWKKIPGWHCSGSASLSSAYLQGRTSVLPWRMHSIKTVNQKPYNIRSSFK